LKPAVPLSRYLVFFALVIGGCALDLASKSWMFAKLGMPGLQPEPEWLWNNVFGFQTSLNGGALFGMGQGFWPLFSGLSIVAAIGVFLWLFWGRAARDWLLTIALGLVTAGILGNLYDRLGLPGAIFRDGYPGYAPGRIHAVRDFIVMFQVGDWHWPNYNLADSSLVCGALLLAWHALFVKTDSGCERCEGENAQ
jgi:signal peptidase II